MPTQKRKSIKPTKSKSKVTSIRRTSKKKVKKNNKKKLIIIAIVASISIAGLIAAIIFIPRIIEENQKKELNNNLDRCLSSGYKQIHPGEESRSFLMIRSRIFEEPVYDLGIDSSAEQKSKEYDMAISCYNRYHVDNYKNKIDELQELKDKADLHICVEKAEQNSSISDEEKQAAKNDAVKATALLTRMSNGYQEQINCYEKYDVEESESRISELRIKKSEIDSYIDSSKNSTVNVGGSNYGNTNLYCTTNTIGNYTYTNCY